MVSGWLLIQLTPAMSGAAVPIVNDEPVRGQAAQIARAARRLIENAANRVITFHVYSIKPMRCLPVLVNHCRIR